MVLLDYERREQPTAGHTSTGMWLLLAAGVLSLTVIVVLAVGAEVGAYRRGYR